MIRTYICDECNIYVEKDHKDIHEKLIKKCPKCNKKTLYQDLSGIYVHDGSPKTVGSLAEKNAKRKYWLEDTIRQDKINTGIQKFAPQVKRGVLDKEQAKDLIEKHIDTETPWGEMDKKDEKKIFSGTKEEQATKMETYIEKGTV